MSNLDLPGGAKFKQTNARMNNGMPTIIRDVSVQDATDIRDIYGHYVLNGLSSFELLPPDEDEIRTRIKRIKKRGHPFLAAETDGVISGYAYASTFRQRAAYDYTLENSVYVSPNYLRQGIGVRLLSDLFQVCDQLGIRQLIAVIGDSDNHASINLHARCGFNRVGLLPSTGYKHDRWVDTVLMQRWIGDGDSEPPH